MKKILFVLGLLFISGNVGATSGTCSSHGGVDCIAGPDWDGSAICNDGWNDSSENYNSAAICQDTPWCTVSEKATIKSKYNFSGLIAEYNELNNQLLTITAEADKAIENNNSNPYASEGNRAGMEAKIKQEAFAKSSLVIAQMDSKDNALNSLARSANVECYSLGLSNQPQKKIETQQLSRATVDSIINDVVQNYTPMCPAYSQYENGRCNCINGYAVGDGACVPAEKACQIKWGIHSYAESKKCYCSNGYELNVDTSNCVAKKIVASVTPQVLGASTTVPAKLTREQLLNKINEIIALINSLKEQLAAMGK